MKNLVFAVFENDATGESFGGVYTWEEFHKANFSPCYECTIKFDFVIRGNNYKAKKLCAESKAIKFSNFGYLADLSYNELAILSAFFEKVGKRYGLISEFRENAIC